MTTPPVAPPGLPQARTTVAALLLAAGAVASLLGASRSPAHLAPLPDEACTSGTMVQVMAPELRLGASGAQRCAATFAAPWQPLAAASDPFRLVRQAGDTPPLRPPGTLPLVAEPLGAHFASYAVVPSSGGPEDGDDAGPSFDLVDRVRGATVAVESDAGSRACDRWLFGRWFCGPADWNYVGPSDVTVRGRAERCLWLHPTDEGDLVVRYAGVPGATQLRGRMALADAAADNEAGAPVRFEVRAWPDAGERPAEAMYSREHTSRRGWSSWRVDLPEASELIVELRVAADEVGQRHFCVTGATRVTARAQPRDADQAPQGEADDVPTSRPMDGSGAAEGSAGVEGSGAPTPRRPARVPRERERVPGQMFLDDPQRREAQPSGRR